jgi:hypothetical protein
LEGVVHVDVTALEKLWERWELDETPFLNGGVVTRTASERKPSVFLKDAVTGADFDRLGEDALVGQPKNRKRTKNTKNAHMTLFSFCRLLLSRSDNASLRTFASTYARPSPRGVQRALALLSDRELTRDSNSERDSERDSEHEHEHEPVVPDVFPFASEELAGPNEPLTPLAALALSATIPGNVTTTLAAFAQMAQVAQGILVEIGDFSLASLSSLASPASPSFSFPYPALSAGAFLPSTPIRISVAVFTLVVMLGSPDSFEFAKANLKALGAWDAQPTEELARNARAFAVADMKASRAQTRRLATLDTDANVDRALASAVQVQLSEATRLNAELATELEREQRSRAEHLGAAAEAVSALTAQIKHKDEALAGAMQELQRTKEEAEQIAAAALKDKRVWEERFQVIEERTQRALDSAAIAVQNAQDAGERAVADAIQTLSEEKGTAISRLHAELAAVRAQLVSAQLRGATLIAEKDAALAVAEREKSNARDIERQLADQRASETERVQNSLDAAQRERKSAFESENVAIQQALDSLTTLASRASEAAGDASLRSVSMRQDNTENETNTTQETATEHARRFQALLPSLPTVLSKLPTIPSADHTQQHFARHNIHKSHRSHRSCPPGRVHSLRANSKSPCVKQCRRGTRRGFGSTRCHKSPTKVKSKK